MSNTIRLGVNIDHIATLRQARGTQYPDPVQAAFIAADAGADGVTLHLREDRRHIQDRDVTLLASTLQIPMNLEMAVTDEMIAIAKRIKPAHCCLVPEKREELTTEGGLNICGQQDKIREAIAQLGEAGINVSLFIDADDRQIQAAAAVGASTIELHTGGYADATDPSDELARLIRGAEQAHALGLTVNAGHGLHYHNVQAILQLPHLHELNIGHSIIARAVFSGLAAAVRDMKNLLRG